MSTAGVSDNTQQAAGAEASQARRALMREEQEIAREYLGRVPWEMVVWGLGNFALWVSLFPLDRPFEGSLDLQICHVPSFGRASTLDNTFLVLTLPS